MKAILTRYTGPTNVKGSRILASAEGGSKPHRISVSYDHALNLDENHAAAAKALRDKMGWKGEMIGGGLPNGDMAWVFAGEGSPRFNPKPRSKMKTSNQTMRDAVKHALSRAAFDPTARNFLKEPGVKKYLPKPPHKTGRNPRAGGFRVHEHATDKLIRSGFATEKAAWHWVSNNLGNIERYVVRGPGVASMTTAPPTRTNPKRRKAPSPAQIAARKRFAQMARAGAFTRKNPVRKFSRRRLRVWAKNSQPDMYRRRKTLLARKTVDAYERVRKLENKPRKNPAAPTRYMIAIEIRPGKIEFYQEAGISQIRTTALPNLARKFDSPREANRAVNKIAYATQKRCAVVTGKTTVADLRKLFAH